MKEQDEMKSIRKLLRNELVDCEIFTRLAKGEKDRDLKVLLGRLAKMERAHMKMWAEIVGTEEPKLGMASWTMTLKIYSFILARMFLGVGFITMLVGKNEIAAIERYTNTVKHVKLSEMDRKRINTIIADEKYTEIDLRERIKEYKGQINHIRSIVFGLNDGLVEVLAAVAGIAVVASSGTVVVVAGIIIGISGTLSMAGGSYLSSRSHNLVEDIEEDEQISINTSPLQEALYAGVYYFLGSLVSVIPFILGLVGFEGIIAAVILVSIVLTTVSVIVAVVSGSSIRNRVLEMIGISLGAVVVTVILGTIAKHYFGVVI